MHYKSEFTTTIIAHLKSLEPQLIIIFGSFADNSHNQHSDIDIAFYTKQTIDNYTRWLTAQNLARKLNIDVDLVDLKTANDVLKFQIASRGKIILNHKMDWFLDRCYTDYFTLNDDRQEIL